MNKYEELARKIHKEGHLCSYAVYHAFCDDYDIKEDFPAPRSIDGKCGVLLTCQKILKDLGKVDLIPLYEEKFIQEFKYTKCLDLIKNGRVCNDNIGIGSRILSEMLEDNK